MEEEEEKRESMDKGMRGGWMRVEDSSWCNVTYPMQFGGFVLALTALSLPVLTLTMFVIYRRYLQPDSIEIKRRNSILCAVSVCVSQCLVCFYTTFIA